MKRALNMIGHVSGYLTVIERADNIGTRAMWLCRCKCGNLTTVRGSHLRACGVKSCGCLVIEKLVAQTITHGKSRAPIYKIWRDMRDRCTVTTHHAYRLYGARGIRVCDRWQLFENFLADMGEAPEGLSIDRYPDKDGNYEPGNCRWATDRQQARNRSTSTFLTFDGITLPLPDWADKFSLSQICLTNRIKRGWSLERAFNQPQHGYRKAA